MWSVIIFSNIFIPHPGNFQHSKRYRKGFDDFVVFENTEFYKHVRYSSPNRWKKILGVNWFYSDKLILKIKKNIAFYLLEKKIIHFIRYDLILENKHEPLNIIETDKNFTWNYCYFNIIYYYYLIFEWINCILLYTSLSIKSIQFAFAFQSCVISHWGSIFAPQPV